MIADGKRYQILNSNVASEWSGQNANDKVIHLPSEWDEAIQERYAARHNSKTK
jgi:hypothetical protein